MAAPDGLIALRSSFGVDESMTRLDAAIAKRGLQVFAKIDHGAGAQAVGLELRPTIVVLLGNAKGGTPLMQAAQTIGIDLPLRVLIYIDDAGQTWLAYNDPSWIAKRHGVDDSHVAQLATVLAAIARETV